LVLKFRLNQILKTRTKIKLVTLGMLPNLHQLTLLFSLIFQILFTFHAMESKSLIKYK